jgi:hypothetical protein
METTLVNNPMIMKMAQKNSAKITNIRDVAGPKPIKSKKVCFMVSNLISFAYPCDIIRIPIAIRRINMAVLKAKAL